MKRNVILLLIALLPMTIMAQSYDDLWKKAREANNKDLPRTEIEVLEHIQKKAESEKNYGQLLAAGLKRAGLQTQISPDSLEVEVARLEAKTEQYDTVDPTLAAVCRALLGKIYVANDLLGDNHEQVGKEYFDKALANPKRLADVKCTDYKPLVLTDIDSQIFDDDMLHVIGMEAKRYDLLSKYYSETGNRRAACLTRLSNLRILRQTELSNKEYLAELEKMLAEYGDLDVAGEVAMERFENMKGTDTERYHYAEEILQRWGSWGRTVSVRNSMESMKAPRYEANYGDNRMLPYLPRTVQLSAVRNIDQLTLTIWKLKGDGEDEYYLYNEAQIEKVKKQIEGAPVQTITREYSGMEPWESTRDSMVISGLRPGLYFMEMKANKKEVNPCYEVVYVSDVLVIWEEQPRKTIRYAVVSATTGKPIPGAKLKLSLGNRWDEKKETKTLETDQHGECVYTYQDRAPWAAYAYTENDKASKSSDVSSSFSYSKGSSSSYHIRVYTDRSIYRPGQTVHAAVLSYHRFNKEQFEVRANDTIRVRILDANRQSVAEKKVATDEFGKATVDFVLPTSGLTGSYTVQGVGKTNGNTTIKVEEYKRPTFELSFDDYKEKYAPGDTVRVKGYAKTYAGVPVQGAKVKYSVTRRQALWCWWYHSNEEDNEVFSGETTTDDEGAFYMRIPVIIPKASDLFEDGEQDPFWRRGLFYNFIAKADVTDMGGETHGGSFSLPMGTKSTSLSSNLPSRTLAEEFKSVTYRYVNAAGEEIDGTVRLTVDGKKFEGGKAFPANKPVNIGRLTSGRHTITAICGDNELTENIVVFAMTDKRPVINTHDWFYTTSETFPTDGKPVYVQFGSSDKDQHVFYSLFAGDQVLESGTLEHNNTLTTREFKYKEEYGDGITFTCAWVRNGELYYHTTNISKPEPDKRLKLEWKTFRDRLVPGQMEEWSLTVKTPDGKPAEAQLMATMYDKSLDQLYGHSWSLSTSVYRSKAQTQWAALPSSNLSCGNTARSSYTYVPTLSYAKFNPSYFEGLLYRVYRNFNTSLRKIRVREAAGAREEVDRLMAAPMSVEGNVEVKMLKREVALEAADMKMDNAVQEAEAPEPQNQMRENLNETAFFYPQLVADGNGVVAIKFTLPESLTTWRFLGIAHDKEMNHGSISGEAIAQKTVMVSPNVPRFVRQGDRATISTRLMSTAEKAITGTAQLQLIDPQTEKVVYTTSQPFSIKPQGTSSATFTIEPSVLDDYSLLIARISAQGDGYSDGEQHYLPVLSNKEQVINTLPFTQHGTGTKTIDLTKLFPENTTNHRLSVEYTNHPSWLMVQALPYVADANEHNAISLVSAYYSNLLGQNIINSNPKIRETLDAWKAEESEEGSKGGSLLSSLEKNQELKTLVLNETPWVLDSQQETKLKHDKLLRQEHDGETTRLDT